MNNALNFIQALTKATDSAHEDRSSYWVYPRQSHAGETLWAIDSPDNADEIRDEEYCHPDCTVIVEIGKRGEIAFLPRKEALEEEI